jgi:hypothetical protein
MTEIAVRQTLTDSGRAAMVSIAFLRVLAIS